MSGFKGTFFLLVVVGALFGAYLWFGQEPQREPTPDELVIAGSRVGQARKLVITRRGAEPIEIERAERGQYRMVEPLRDRVSLARIRHIAEAFDRATMAPFASPEDLREDPELLDRTGLRVPLATLTLLFDEPQGAAGQVELTVHLGEKDPLGNDRFVLRDGTIYRGGLGLFNSLQANVDDLRDRRIFLHERNTADYVEVQMPTGTGGRETLAVRRKGAEWRMEQPFSSRVEVGILDRFLALVLGMRIEEFILGEIALPAREPEYEVRITGGGRTEHVILWREGDVIVGKDIARNLGFLIARGTFVNVFHRAVGDLRARWLFPFGVDDAEDIAIDPGQGTLRVLLHRDGDGPFRMVEPVAVELHATPLNQVLQALRQLQAVEFVDGDPGDPAFGLDAEFLTLSIKGQGQRQPVTLYLGANRGEATYCRRADEEQVVLVPRAAVEPFRRPWTVYPQRTVLELTVPPQGMILAWQAGERRFERRQGVWHRIAAAATEMPERLAELVDSLRDLRARQALAAGDLPAGEDLTLVLTRAQARDALATLTLRLPEPGAEQGPVYVRHPRHEELWFLLSRRDGVDLRWLIGQR